MINETEWRAGMRVFLCHKADGAEPVAGRLVGLPDSLRFHD